jgi:hypothetical protein
VLSAFGILTAVQGDGAQADQVALLVEELLAVVEADDHLVSRLRSEVVCPPQFDLLDPGRRCARQCSTCCVLRNQRNSEEVLFPPGAISSTSATGRRPCWSCAASTRTVRSAVRRSTSTRSVRT